MANPTASPAIGYEVDGVWLHPYERSSPRGLVADRMAWVGSNSPELTTPMEGNIFSVPGRRERVAQGLTFHLDEGVLQGLLIDRHGLTATAWVRRLQYLVLHQRDFRHILLVTNRYLFAVQLLGDFVKTPDGPNWRVSLPFREVTWDEAHTPSVGGVIGWG